ncbi:MAG: HAD family hydrolase [Hyphomicrobiales bacterium]
MSDTARIKDIIFDLGGVIIDVNPRLSVQYFIDRGYSEAKVFAEEKSAKNIFDKLERGVITPKEYKRRIKEVLKTEVSDEIIVDAWNAMLGDMPSERIDVLKDCKAHYGIHLLSNTNKIHYDEYIERFKEVSKFNTFEELFQETFFSYRLHLSKPNPEIFEYALYTLDAKAEEVLFIDDNLDNCRAAASVGMKALHLDLGKGMDIRKVFHQGQLEEDVKFL